MTATPALDERAHIHDAVADEMGIDVDRLRADIADQIRTPLQPQVQP